MTDAEALHRASPCVQKRLVKIPCAGHNDLLMQGFATYFSQLRSFVESISTGGKTA